MMITRKNIFFLGLFILATQYLFGLPTAWKNVLITLAALAIIFVSVKINIPRKNLKLKIKRDRPLSDLPPTPTPVQTPVVVPQSPPSFKPVDSIKPKSPRRPKKSEIV